MPVAFSPRCLLLTLGLATLSATSRAEDPLRYNRDIRPILAETCFRCHGPGVQKAELRLDSAESAQAKAKSGAVAIVPGRADESELIARILSDDTEQVMPPPSSKKTLGPGQKETLRRWIAEGAKYEKHWAFEAPAKLNPPAIDAAGFRVNNPIDAFLGDRLRREGLTMSEEADRPTLIRRVAFTLTGLPPTPQEVDLYMGDSSSRAYENMVERYLHSPRYGEEMARHWLDAARYADTHGLHLDNERQMWLYRDWVVSAFNDNQPFDQCTVEQIAGDLIPGATPRQMIATGFNRCNVTTGEGGSIDSEWYFRNAVDRTGTVAETWMGLTVACAQCHDHKFDPVSQEEFYSLYSFFYQAAGPALDSNALAHEPFLKVPTAAETQKLEDLTKSLAEARANLEAAFQAISYIDPRDLPTPGVSPSSDVSHSFRAWLKDGKDAPPEIAPLLEKARAATASEAERDALRRFYLQRVCATTSAPFAPLIDRVATLEKERAALDGAIPGTFIFKETDTPREAFVMMRGQYDKPGKKVEPSTPAALPPLKKAKASASRLDLARWLVAAEHPLTSRVTVNRFWQQVFGVGLVKTSFDFGTQGEPPTHPELLDWLAVAFQESGWDVKGLMRMMVTSAAFRQSTRVTPELLQKDPENRLYARGPRFRLDAEQIRDNALFVGELMSLKMGGRGVRPYQPPNIWEPVAFTGSNTRSYEPDKGPSLYRRSLYTFLKRTAPPPFMANFDAPSREFFCARRERSNTPLQALQLMNDVQQFEAARALAQRVMIEGGDSPRDRLAFAWKVVLARAADPEELDALELQWKTELARFQGDPESAAKLVKTGDSAIRPGLPEPELAAYAMVASTLLNLDETVTRN